MPGDKKKKKKSKTRHRNLLYARDTPPTHTHFRRKLLGSENCVLKLRTNISWWKECSLPQPL